MGFFFGSKKKKANVIETLNKILETPHKLSVIQPAFTVSSFLLSVGENFIILNEFEPKKYNYQIGSFLRIKIEIEEVRNFQHYNYSFKTAFMREVDFKGTKAYQFELPTTLKVIEQPYTIYPSSKNQITIGFTLKNIHYYKKVTGINKEEIQFTGYFEHLKTYFGTTIYEIELKLPLNRLSLSANFIHNNDKKYSLRDFITNDDIEEVLDNFALEYFIYSNDLPYMRNKIKHTKAIKNYLENDEFDKSDENTIQKILLVDDKPIITDIVTEILEARTDYLIISTNKSTETFELALENNPDLILLDINMPKMDGIQVAEELKKNRITANIPIVFMTVSSNQLHVVAASKLNVEGYLLKPIDSNTLINKISSILKIKRNASKFTGKTIFICADDDEYSRSLINNLKLKDYEIISFQDPERMFRYKDKKKADILIIRLLERKDVILPVVNSVRRKNEFKNCRMLVFPVTGIGAEFLNALDDDKLVVVENAAKPEYIAQNLPLLLLEK